VTSAVRHSETRLGIATAVRCVDGWLVVTLSSAREIRVPLANYPRLAHATADQRRNVQIEAGGTSLYWPDVDEDVGVAQLLGVSEEDLYRFAGFTIHSSRPGQ
jgi:hypothetical protein